MNRFILIGIAVLALAAIILSINLLIKSPEVDTKSKTLVMGVSLDYPPFEFMKNGEPMGYDIELAHILAKELGFNLKIKDMDFNSLIPALNSGQIDFIISSMSQTDERAKSVDFSRLYYRSKVAIVTKREADAEGILHFSNTKIGVQMGSTMEIYAKQKQLSVKNMSILAISRVPQLIEELKLGRLDGVLLEADVAKAIVSKTQSLKSTMVKDFDGGYAIVFAKNSSLVSEFNQVLEQLERSGKLRELESKWVVKGRSYGS